MYGNPPLPNAGFAEWLFATMHMGNNALLNTLIVLIFADIVTGVSKSYITSTTDSSVGKKGFAIHVTIILLVLLLYPWSIAIHYQWVGDSVLIVWIFMYATSIVENIGQMGLPLPNFIKQRLNKLKTDSLEYEPKEENKGESK